jgi:hypothetical protein
LRDLLLTTDIPVRTDTLRKLFHQEFLYGWAEAIRKDWAENAIQDDRCRARRDKERDRHERARSNTI